MASKSVAVPSQAEHIRVLHLDDDPAVLELTATFLKEEVRDVVVEGANTPEAALEALEDGEFDCVVSDYDMPSMNGLEFFEAVRERDETVPFVLYTGKGSEEIASRALNAGVTGYFQKGGSDQQRRLANRVEQAAEEYRTKIDADRYSTVLRALGYPIYVVDEEGRFEFVNEAFVELTGYDRETIVGSPPDLVKDDRAVRRAEEELGEILSSEGPDISRFPINVVPKEGDPVPCRDHMAALPYEGEQFRGSVGILRNVSDEQRRERELETRTKALDETPIGIVITGTRADDHPIQYVNDSFVELTGYDREEILGRNCRVLQGENTREEPVAELRAAFDAEEPTTVELRNYRADGELFWNRVTVAPLWNDRGEVTNWVGFQEEVTEQKETEQSLQWQNERLDAFASVVSHDLRNPIGVAQGNLELLREEHDPEAVDRIGRALDRMDTIVEDTLTLAKQGEAVGAVVQVDVGNVATECWGTVATGSLALEVEEGITVSADASRLRNLFENLFRNAVEHAGPDATVRVGALEDGFYVADDGPGIPDGERSSAFEPGFTTEEGGTGFGLAIVKGIVDAHGWTVAATESESGGARFEITGVDDA